jgi:Protein of unknown function (DUF2752)
MDRRAARALPARDLTRPALIAAGCLPFAAAALIERGGVELPCPFRELTGLPCPFCGATRAFALAAHGDLAFADYNAVWVLVAVAVAAAGLGRAKPPPAWIYAAVIVVAWGYALAQRGTITTG